MYIIYVLQSDDGRLYKGMTNNLHRRLEEHKKGGTKTTKKFTGIKVVYQETQKSRFLARKREKYLKSAAGRKFLKRMLR